SCRGGATRLPISVRTPAAASPAQATPDVAVDAATMNRKLLFGYQGWFGCPEDGSPLETWQHWFRPGEPSKAAGLRVGMWPDVAELDADERCETSMSMPDGRRAELYSAYNPKTVARHFRWMQEYGLAGVFLQRFTVRLEDQATLAFRDRVATNVRAS